MAVDRRIAIATCGESAPRNALAFYAAQENWGESEHGLSSGAITPTHPPSIWMVAREHITALTEPTAADARQSMRPVHARLPHYTTPAMCNVDHATLPCCQCESCRIDTAQIDATVRVGRKHPRASHGLYKRRDPCRNTSARFPLANLVRDKTVLGYRSQPVDVTL